MATHRLPPTAPKITSEGIRAAQALDRDRAKTKRKAKAAAKRDAKQATIERLAAEAMARAAAHADQDHANALATAKADAEALGVPLEQMLEEMGIDETGAPKTPLEAPEPVKLGYDGPMLALRRARTAYVKGANGNPHTNDQIGNFFAAAKREDVVRICMKALGHTVNKYAALNPGQQSMNYRNSVRGAIKRNELTFEALVAASKA